jgi:hypothetical protein
LFLTTASHSFPGLPWVDLQVNASGLDAFMPQKDLHMVKGHPLFHASNNKGMSKIHQRETGVNIDYGRDCAFSTILPTRRIIHKLFKFCDYYVKWNG